MVGFGNVHSLELRGTAKIRKIYGVCTTRTLSPKHSPSTMMPLTVSFAPVPPANQAQFEFSWSTWSSPPRADLNYFPAILSGRIDPLELKNTVEAMNLYVATTWTRYRRRAAIPLILIPIGIFLIVASSNLWHTGYSGVNAILWVGIALLSLSSVFSMSMVARYRRNFDAMVTGLREMVARTNARFAPYGVFWSIHVEERLVRTGRGRIRTRPVMHLVIEVANAMQPVAAAVPVAAWGASPHAAVPQTQPYAPAPPQGQAWYPQQQQPQVVATAPSPHQHQQQYQEGGYGMDPTASTDGYSKL